MSYDALLAKLRETVEAAGPLGINTSQGTTLAAPAHEMAACVEALVEMEDAVRRMAPGHIPNPVAEYAHCEACKALSTTKDALTALAAAMGVAT